MIPTVSRTNVVNFPVDSIETQHFLHGRAMARATLSCPVGAIHLVHASTFSELACYVNVGATIGRPCKGSDFAETLDIGGKFPAGQSGGLSLREGGMCTVGAGFPDPNGLVVESVLGRETRPLRTHWNLLHRLQFLP